MMIEPAQLADRPSGALPMDQAVLDSLSEDLGVSGSKRVLRLFQNGLRQYCDRIIENIADNNLPITKQTAHGLKGLCMQFGATHSMELAKMIELKVQTIEEARAVLGRLVEEITRVEEFVALWAGDAPENP
jgi:HPt (histidine-containing phosphotransfer) domain-containing protein